MKEKSIKEIRVLCNNCNEEQPEEADPIYLKPADMLLENPLQQTQSREFNCLKCNASVTVLLQF